MWRMHFPEHKGKQEQAVDNKFSFRLIGSARSLVQLLTWLQVSEYRNVLDTERW